MGLPNMPEHELAKAHNVQQIGLRHTASYVTVSLSSLFSESLDVFRSDGFVSYQDEIPNPIHCPTKSNL